MIINDINHKHYLITRFNLRQNTWVNANSYNPLAVIDDSWLEERFALFEQYCFPSVAAQTEKNFTWLVYFDIDTPVKYKDIIESYQKCFPVFTPKFIPSMEHLFESLKTDIIANAGDMIITSRLDNDDSLHEDYLSEIHKCIRNNSIKKGVIDITSGYCLQIGVDALLYRSIQYSNPFITYLEPYVTQQKITTVMDKPHHNWLFSVNTFFIYDKALWMQIIHQKNVLNKTQGKIAIDHNCLAAFNLNVNLRFAEVARARLIVVNYLKYPVYIVKKKLKKAYLKLKTTKTN